MIEEIKRGMERAVSSMDGRERCPKCQSIVGTMRWDTGQQHVCPNECFNFIRFENSDART